jgi:ATP-dependent Clp protease ATP-binding subunit ClpA
VFERFTEGARQVVVLAQDEAQRLRHNYIGTEHLLLGLLNEEEGVAARVLESLDITLEEMRAQIARIVGQGDDVTTGQIPFTPRAKKVLDLAMREALSLGHNYIGTEHILLGIVRENEGVAARILLDFDADAEMIRNEVLRVVSGKELSGRAPREPGDRLKHSHITLRGFRPGPSLPHRSRQISMGGRPPWWQPIVHHTDFWFGMLLGSLLFGAGLLIGWLIWG